MKNLDEIAKGYNDLHNEWKTLENMVRNNEFNKFLAHVKSTKNVLEIGLGDGVFTKMLAEKFNSVIAVDGSQVTIDNVEKDLSNFKNIEYICSYIEDLKLDSKVDNIVMSHILEHLDKPVEALENLKNIMNEDTVLYISVPNAMSIHRQVAVKMGLLEQVTQLNDTDHRLGHKIVYKPENFQEDIKKAGFKIVEFGGSMIKPLANKQIEDNWTSEMIDGFIKLGDDYPELCGDIYVVAKLG